MEKFRPNLEREGALDTVLEVPIPHKNTTTLWNRMKSLMTTAATVEIQSLLRVIGAPLTRAFLSLKSDDDHQPLNRNIILEQWAARARYIVKQYLAAAGRDEALNSIDSLCMTGKVKMAASNGNKLGILKSFGGGFVMWQKRPELWCLELILSDYKTSVGSDGKASLPWHHHSQACRVPPPPLEHLLLGLDPRSTANLFSNSIWIGDKSINNEDCFILKLELEPLTLKARSSSNVEIVLHTVLGYFSQRTGLLVQLEDSHHLRMTACGENSVHWQTTMESSIKDYRTIDGVNIAHGGRTCVWLRSKRWEGGTGTRILELVWTLEEVDCNCKGLSMECFLPPGD
ncbi:hypothetical protein M0R45_037474 [Rubus argutus]|uniref:Uncharacterized protein n=1 Tax=Rubus argutus TaxID=59490 RepID=A0AAW1W233_RUBAR